MRRAVRVATSAIVSAIALGACGSSGDGISAAARERMTDIVDQVRQRAAAHDSIGAERALATLRRNVARFEHDGAIGDADADAILRAAVAVERRLTLITTTTTTTTTTVPAEPEDEQGKDHDKDHDKGRGREHGHDKDDDRGH